MEQTEINFKDSVVCDCGTRYYGHLPNVCVFCEANKIYKIEANWKEDSGYRLAIMNCSGCFYSTIVENGSLTCLAIDGIEMSVQVNCICRAWTDNNDEEDDNDSN